MAGLTSHFSFMSKQYIEYEFGDGSTIRTEVPLRKIIRQLPKRCRGYRFYTEDFAGGNGDNTGEPVRRNESMLFVVGQLMTVGEIKAYRSLGGELSEPFNTLSDNELFLVTSDLEVYNFDSEKHHLVI